MPGIAENALELANTQSFLTEDQYILINIETTASCHFTKRCGDHCILNKVNSMAREPMSPDTVLQIADELFSSTHSHRIRHVGAVGKEVLDAPELLIEIAKRWHRTPSFRRPGTLGIISAAAEPMNQFASSLVENPLSWVNISIDTSAVDLRTQANAAPLLASALNLRKIGGVQAVGVNTLLSRGNLDQVVEIGRRVERAGVDQWSIGPFLAPRSNGRMEPVAETADFRRAIDRVIAEFADSPMNILYEMDYTELLALVGDEARLRDGRNRWRHEYSLSRCLKLIATNPREGFFLRVRWDGELLAKHDFRTVGLEHGRYGSYQPGRIVELLAQFAKEKENAALQNV
jgi:hypothetical protein